MCAALQPYNVTTPPMQTLPPAGYGGSMDYGTLAALPMGSGNATLDGILNDTNMTLSSLYNQGVPQLQQAALSNPSQQQNIQQQYLQQLNTQYVPTASSSTASTPTSSVAAASPSNGTSTVGSPKAKGKPYLRLVPTNEKDEYGNIRMKLQRIDAQGQVIGELAAVSGAPSKQSLRDTGASQSGSSEPVPEGTFSLGTPRSSTTEGVGPMFCPVEGTGNRQAIGIHLDANRSSAPGTAGCIGLLSQADLNTFSQWMQDSSRPQEIEVNYGLGTV